jgi:RNA polymerase sigma-70 factor (ECF subfamily)
MHSRDRVWLEHGLRSAVLAGDEQAWRTWYEESFAELAAYVTWRCAGQGDLAEEVVQDTWLTAVRRIGDFDPQQGSFAGWLRGIAANLLRNHFRRRRQERKHVQALDREGPITGSVETALERQEQAEQIACALTLLPKHYEAVLRAKYLEERSVADIAEAWSETAKTIESLLTRARQAFREAYRR